jgi:pilus assembly protein CpaD
MTAMMKQLTGALLLPLLLAACGGFNGVEQAQYDAARRHPIAVDPQIMTYEIPAAPDKIALTLEDKSALRALARAFKERGHGSLNIAAPSGSPNTGVALNLSTEIGQLLHEEGIAHSDISHGTYRASAANSAAPLILSYRRYVATPSPCGNWGDYAYNPKNVVTSNLGCASQNNMAAILADPADLKGPRGTDPAYAPRRDEVLTKYRKGESTATERVEEESGNVSEVSR